MTLRTCRYRRRVSVAFIDRRYVGRIILDRDTAADLVAEWRDAK
jgi:hypothetical protein